MTTLQPSSAGYAKALAAAALHVLTGKPHRLVWEVDAERDIVLPKGDPTAPDAGEWGAVLMRFRSALDAQPHGQYKAKIVLALITNTPSHGRCRAVFAIPWNINFTCFGRKPPLGRWKIEALPPYRSGLQDCEGDMAPADFWYDGIPFALLLGPGLWWVLEAVYAGALDACGWG